MKIIDEKGRLFGKINVIDFLVIFFIFCLIIPMFYFGYKMFNRKDIIITKPPEEFIESELEMDFKFINLQPEILKLIALQDKEVDENGIVIGQVVWIGESRPYQYKINLGDGDIIYKEAIGLKELPVKLKIKAVLKGNNIYYKDKQIIFNSPINFDTGKYTVEAILVKREMFIGSTFSLEIDCILGKIDSEVAKLIAVGDREEVDGVIIGEIIWLGESRPQQYKFAFDSKEYIETDTVFKEPPARFRLKTTIIDNRLYYKEKPIISGLPIYFKTNKYALEIIPVIEKDEKAKIEAIIKGAKIREMDLNFTLKNLTEDTLRLISVGDKALDDKGEVIAEILSIGKIENSTYEIDLGNRNFITVEDSNKKQLFVKMRIKGWVNENGELFFKDKYVTSTSVLEFKMDKYVVRGMIAKTYQTSPIQLPEKWVQIKVKFSGIIPEVAKVISEGDIEKIPAGKAVGILKKIVTNKSSDILIIKDEQFKIISHPFQRDIIAVLDLLGTDKEGVFYFKNYPLKIGNLVTFTTELYSISGEIIGLEYK